MSSPPEQEEYSRILQELFHFGVVFSFNFLVVEKIFLLAFMFYELKSMAVESVFILVPSNIVDNDTLGGMRARIIVCLTVTMVSDCHLPSSKRNSPNVKGSRQSSITGILVIVQLGSNIMLRMFRLPSKRFDNLAQGMAWSMLNSSTSHGQIYLEKYLIFQRGFFWSFKYYVQNVSSVKSKAMIYNI